MLEELRYAILRKMAVERPILSRRAVVGSAVGATLGRFKASGEVLGSGNAPEVEKIASPEAIEFAGTVRWAVETRDSEFFETLVHRPIVLGQKPLEISFSSRPEAIRIHKEQEEYQVVFKDLRLGLVQDSSRVSIVKFGNLGGAWVVSEVEELSKAELNKRFSEIEVWDAPPPADGTWARHFWLRRGEIHAHPDAVIHKDPGYVFLYVPGMTSSVVSGGGGMEATRLFLPLQSKLGPPFKPSWNVQMSWNGVEFDLETGLSSAKTQYCQETLSSPVWRERMLYGVISEFFSIHPNKKLTICTHSEGCHPVFLFMKRIREEIERNPDFPIKPENINIILTHAPALGVNHRIFELLAKVDREIPDDCKGLLGPPALGVLNSDTAKYMTGLWDRRQAWKRELKDLVLWLRDRKGSVASLGSWQDVAFSGAYVGMFSFFVDLNLKFDPESKDQLLTQVVPGADPAEMRYLGTHGLGHAGAWKSEEGLDWIKNTAKKAWKI
ncbi:MAG: hypothetical protein AAB599_02705 [Patescibacteria group bacterium]